MRKNIFEMRGNIFQMRKTNLKFVLKSFNIYSSDKQPPPMAQLDDKSARQVQHFSPNESHEFFQI